MAELGGLESAATQPEERDHLAFEDQAGTESIEDPPINELRNTESEFESSLPEVEKPEVEPMYEERRRWEDDPRNGERERYGHDEDREAVTAAAFEREGSQLGPETLKSINDGPQRLETKLVDLSGRTTNCGECARAVASTLDGHPHAADTIDERVVDPEGESLSSMETWVGDRFSEPGEPAEVKAQLEAQLLARGEGSHVIIECDWKTLRERQAEWSGELAVDQGDPLLDARRGHFFNAMLRGGEVMYIDGQGGEMSAQLGAEYAADSYSWCFVSPRLANGGQH